MPGIRWMAVCVTASTIALGGAAQAQELGVVATILFDRLDTDRNGAISKEELRAYRSRLFDRYDADGDQFVTLAEIEQEQRRSRQKLAGRLARKPDALAQMPTPDERFSSLDRDKDGKLSRQEYVGGADAWIESFGGSGTGLTKAQFAAFLGGKR